MTENLDTVHGRPVLRMRRRLRHPAAKVWRALTEPGELSRWYPFRATEVDLRPGGTIRFTDQDGGRHDAIITDVEPDRVFGFRVAEPGTPGGRERDNRLRFELHPDPDGCLLVFTHTFTDRPAAASYAAGWQGCFEALAAALAGEPAGPADPARMITRHEHFVSEFGLDRGSTGRTAAGSTARIDRQLMMRDVDTVWAALTAAAPGPAATVEAPTLLEYPLPDGGRLRWELGTGPGGARVGLTRTGGGDPEDTLAAARADLAALLTRLDPR